MRTSILGVPLDDLSLDEILERISNGERLFQIFINIHKLVLFHKDRRFSAVRNAEGGVFSVDGRWVQFLARLKGITLKERFGGQEVINQCFSIARGRGYRIYLLGARKAVLEKASTVLKNSFPDACIVGAQDGFFDSENKVIEDIKDKKPHMLFLALPSPRKELLGCRIFQEVQSLNYVAGVGGAFDIIAGEFKRAPKIVQNFGLEWFWRCIFNVKLFPRYIYDFFYILRLLFGCKASLL